MIEENDKHDPKDEAAGNATSEEKTTSDDNEQVADTELDDAAGGAYSLY